MPTAAGQSVAVCSRHRGQKEAAMTG